MLVEDRSDHAYTPALAVAACGFFAKHFMEVDIEPNYEATMPFPEEVIRCTSSGQVRGELLNSRSVFEMCGDRLRELQARQAMRSRDERKAAARECLLKSVHAHRTRCDLNPRTYWSGALADLLVTARVWWSQPDLLGHALCFRDAGVEAEGAPVTIALWDGGTSSLQPHRSWIRAQAKAGRSVMVLDVSGVGALAPHRLLAGCAPLPGGTRGWPLCHVAPGV